MWYNKNGNCSTFYVDESELESNLEECEFVYYDIVENLKTYKFSTVTKTVDF